jgi:hypothetical protein
VPNFASGNIGSRTGQEAMETPSSSSSSSTGRQAPAQDGTS